MLQKIKQDKKHLPFDVKMEEENKFFLLTIFWTVHYLGCPSSGVEGRALAVGAMAELLSYQ